MKRAAVDVMTVVTLLCLVGVVTFWARSYFFRDILDSYHDVPPPEPGAYTKWGARTEWREHTALSFPGRFEWVFVDTVVRDRRLTRADTQPTLPASFVNGWWLDQRRSVDWRPSSVPMPARLRGGFGTWRDTKTFTVEVADGAYQDSRVANAWGVSLPYWAPAILLALLPGYRIVAAFRSGQIRRLTNRLLLSMSVLLVLVTSALWARSYFVCYTVERSRSFNSPPAPSGSSRDRFQSFCLYSARGTLVGYWRDQHPGGAGPWAARQGARYQLEYHARNRFIPPPNSRSRRLFEGAGVSLWVDRDDVASRDPRELVSEARVSIPYWLPVLAMSAVTVPFCVKALRQRRAEALAQRGGCPQCGYDLRAGHDRCPECGNPASARPHTGS